MSPSASAQQALEGVKKKYGFLPNFLRELGETSPAVLEVYLSGNEAIGKGSLKPRELHAVMLAVSQANGCLYCTKAHSAMLRSLGASGPDIAAINAGSLPEEERLRFLVSAARLIVKKKGWLSREELAGLSRDGVDKSQVYEIVAVIALKTISNYINHISHTEVDPQFNG